jgi:hypothetical protein
MTDTPTTPREVLAKLLADQPMIRDQRTHVAEQLNALSVAEKAEASARSRLNELIASEAAAVTAWSNGETSVSPVADAKGRAALEAEVESTAAKAAEARLAAMPFMNAMSRLNNRAAQTAREIEIAKVAVLFEAIQPVLDGLDAAVRDVQAGLNDACSAADFIAKVARELGRLDTGNPDLEIARPLLAFAENVNARIHAVMSEVPYANTRYPDGARWSAFIAALSSNPSAELEAA